MHSSGLILSHWTFHRLNFLWCEISATNFIFDCLHKHSINFLTMEIAPLKWYPYVSYKYDDKKLGMYDWTLLFLYFLKNSCFTIKSNMQFFDILLFFNFYNVLQLLWFADIYKSIIDKYNTAAGHKSGMLAPSSHLPVGHSSLATCPDAHVFLALHRV